ncbi:zinc-binding dehydrogenase [Nonomuraea polychroma]|uniref:Zinc-binding dehydrogenase n=1 Tax=Nonomuraea polychroma TaxID=46176 RepID=A0A438M5B3_9ACTN|nr:zinc-binding dehydrogenase [Nonomuraea polychroma]RVX41005.1 zinc-binding dehydrogenase [Nonomuraea polychroma]
MACSAALPVAGITARRDLDLLNVAAGDTLLIHGAAGAVGTVAVQLAVARGATVIGTASSANHDYLRSLGAIPVTYGDGLVDRVRSLAPQGIDAVYDIAGQGALPDSITLRGGTADRILTIADAAGPSLGIPLSTTFLPDAARILTEQAEQIVDGTLRITIATALPLADAAKAMQHTKPVTSKEKSSCTVSRPERTGLLHSTAGDGGRAFGTCKATRPARPKAPPPITDWPRLPALTMQRSAFRRTPAHSLVGHSSDAPLDPRRPRPSLASIPASRRRIP